MVEVSPPPQVKIPKAFQKDREVRGYFKTLNSMLFRLWKRTGGGDDLIEGTGALSIQLPSKIAKNLALISALEKLVFEIVITPADFTTKGNQIIICKNTDIINVTLDDSPVIKDRLHIKRTDAIVDVTGTIDGIVNRRINRKLFSLELVFNGTDWSQI